MEPTGLIVVDKPAGITSHDVVARVRRLAKTRRVGHGGTLDPMATGVLVVGVGRATRLLTYVIGAEKGYRATIRLGQSTVTDDAEGSVVAAVPAGHVTDAAIRAGLVDLTGDITQVPSAVSAIKVGGHLTALRRTFVGGCSGPPGEAARAGMPVGFGLDEAVTLDELATRDDPVTLPLNEAAARFFARREATADEARVLAHGGPLPPVGIAAPYAVFDPAGRVLAIVAERDGRARAQVVLAPAS